MVPFFTLKQLKNESDVIRFLKSNSIDDLPIEKVEIICDFLKLDTGGMDDVLRKRLENFYFNNTKNES